MKNKRWIVFTSFFLVSILAVSAAAQDIKSRMRDRLPVIDSLKTEGVVGENNMGFLELKNQKPGSADVVNAENADRTAVYAAIAKQQGTTAALVGKRRAMQIMEIAKPGHWLQDNNGRWYKK